MTIEKLKSLISNNESRTLELKKSTGELKDAMHSACAFLNTDGGTLIFGITPTSLKIVGQEVSDNIRQPHISYPYNPIIAEVLFKTTFLENWGSGVGRIIEKCKECNLQEPEWSVNGGFVTVTFKRPMNDTNEPINDTNEPINDTNEPINKKQQLIMQLIISDPYITQNAISQKLGLSIITIKRHMKEMKDKQVIKYVGNKKSGHWEIIEN